MQRKALKKKNCKQCGAEFTPFKSTEKVCSVSCALEYGKATEAKKREREEKREDREFKKRKAEFRKRDRRVQLDLTQKTFNRMRVMEEKLWFYQQGKQPECVSCGKQNMDWCCGHYKTRGASPELRFSRRNTMLQCNKYCNMSLSGNISGNKHTRGYTQGIIERFGDVKAKELLDYLNSPHKANHTAEWCIDFRRQCNEKIRELQQELAKYE